MDISYYQRRIKQLQKDVIFFLLMCLIVVVAMVLQGFDTLQKLEQYRAIEQENVDLLREQTELRQNLLDAREHENQLMEQQKQDAGTIEQLKHRSNEQGSAEKPINSGKGGVLATYYDYKSIAGYPGFTGHTHPTAASRDYPKGTMLKVCRADDPDRCVEVLVNDYGPQISTGKAIDLSKYAFSKIENLSRGVVKVIITKI